jgi:glucose repression mediator protein
VEAKKYYELILTCDAKHTKALRQLGLFFHQNVELQDQDGAISYLQRSLDADDSDAQTWYLLGKCFMTKQNYRSAYDAYQHAVFRDGSNPTIWCSIGVLYQQINQPREALDAYSRAVNLNPNSSEIWCIVGELYQSCKQPTDALDAYERAAALDHNNQFIQQHLTEIRSQIANGRM